jgi:hypothetical protein
VTNDADYGFDGSFHTVSARGQVALVTATSAAVRLAAAAVTATKPPSHQPPDAGTSGIG